MLALSVITVLVLLTFFVIFYFPRERKEVRRYASWGVINVVRTIWLEDCDRERKEIPVTERHVVSDVLLPKGVGYIYIDIVLCCSTSFSLNMGCYCD